MPGGSSPSTTAAVAVIISAVAVAAAVADVVRLPTVSRRSPENRAASTIQTE